MDAYAEICMALKEEELLITGIFRHNILIKLFTDRSILKCETRDRFFNLK